MKIFSVRLIALTTLALAMPALTAEAKTRRVSSYDGAWQLSFLTRAGSCDSYDFQVNIRRGIISHPNLVRFYGSVSPRGYARASVAVSDKSASGSGRLSANDGRGSWSGYSGTARCSGQWVARRI